MGGGVAGNLEASQPSLVHRTRYDQAFGVWNAPVVCLTLVKLETMSRQVGGYLADKQCMRLE